MATKNETQTKPEDVDAEGAEQAAAAPGRRLSFKLILIAAGGLVALVAGGGGAYQRGGKPQCLGDREPRQAGRVPRHAGRAGEPVRERLRANAQSEGHPRIARPGDAGGDPAGDGGVGDRVAVRVAKPLRKPGMTLAMFESAGDSGNRMEAP
jgi:hypothetical protein